MTDVVINCICLQLDKWFDHLLPEGEAIWGVTSLAGEIFLLREKELDQVEVYDVITYCLLRRLTVPGLRSVADMASCKHFLCIYISDDDGKCVHRLDVQATASTQWTTNDQPCGLSVYASHNVLVTCHKVRKIKEFSSHGNLLRELTLPDDVIRPLHAIQTRENEFLVSHGGLGDAAHRVCKISADGRHIVHSHGGQPGSGHGQYNVPGRLAVDDNEFVFVVDRLNRRVRLLSPTLGHVRDIVSSDQLKWRPLRMCLDVQRNRLYVAENEWNNTSGRVVVSSV